MTLADLSPMRFMNPFSFLKSRKLKHLYADWTAAKAAVDMAIERGDTRAQHDATEWAHRACKAVMRAEMAR